MTSENSATQNSGTQNLESENLADQNAGDALVVYGSATCPYTARLRQWLTAWEVEYRWVDVDEDAAAEQQIAGWNGGRAIRPTVDVGGAILVNPDQSALRTELAAQGLV